MLDKSCSFSVQLWPKKKCVVVGFRGASRVWHLLAHCVLSRCTSNYKIFNKPENKKKTVIRFHKNFCMFALLQAFTFLWEVKLYLKILVPQFSRTWRVCLVLPSSLSIRSHNQITSVVLGILESWVLLFPPRTLSSCSVNELLCGLVPMMK